MPKLREMSYWYMRQVFNLPTIEERKIEAGMKTIAKIFKGRVDLNIYHFF